jgi:tRNA(fMet)-specific endonuclease VapC
MILLDSDHVSVLVDQRQSLRDALIARLRAADQEIGLPVAVLEEHLRGWMAAIHKVRDVYKQIVPYVRLTRLIEFSRQGPIMGWNEPAADHFTRLRRLKIRIGTQDLKIASIALANDALLLSANLRDFQQVPELHVEDWLRS